MVILFLLNYVSHHIYELFHFMMSWSFLYKGIGLHAFVCKGVTVRENTGPSAFELGWLVSFHCLSIPNITTRYPFAAG